MRAAIYYTPPGDTPLAGIAARWLGRSPFGGSTRPATTPESPSLVKVPARYGFHATIKAPFRLAEPATLSDLDAALERFCAEQEAVTISRLGIGELDGFFAFLPHPPAAGLSDLERAVVTGFDRFRAPLSPEEIARRQPDHLSSRQRENLARWGYPHLLEDFRFHLTLTGHVAPAKRLAVRQRLQRHFGPLDGQPLAVDCLALFVEPEPGAPFHVHSIHPFAAGTARRCHAR